MSWIAKMIGVIVMTAFILAIFSPGGIVTSAILIAEKIAVTWCVINFFTSIISGRSVIDIIDEKRLS